MLTILDGLSPA